MQKSSFFSKLIKSWKDIIFRLAFVSYKLKKYTGNNWLITILAYLGIIMIEILLSIISWPFYWGCHPQKLHLYSEDIEDEKARVYSLHYYQRRLAGLWGTTSLFIITIIIIGLTWHSFIPIKIKALLGSSDQLISISKETIIQSNDGSGLINFNVLINQTNLLLPRIKVEYSVDGGQNYVKAILLNAVTGENNLAIDNYQDFQLYDLADLSLTDSPANFNIVWDTKSSENGFGSMAGEKYDAVKLRITISGTVVIGQNLLLPNVAYAQTEEIQDVSAPMENIIEPVAQPTEDVSDQPGLSEENSTDQNVSDEIIYNEENQLEIPDQPSSTESDQSIDNSEVTDYTESGFIDEPINTQFTQQIVFETEIFTVDNQSPQVTAWQMNLGNDYAVIDFSELIKIPEDFNLNVFTIGTGDNYLDLSQSSIELKNQNQILINFDQSLRNYLDSDYTTWFYTADLELNLSAENKITDFWGNENLGQNQVKVAITPVKNNQISEEQKEKTEEEIEDDTEEEELIVLPAAPVRNINRPTKYNSCTVQPISQIIKPGESAEYQVDLKTSLSDAPFELNYGRLPNGVSINIDDNQGFGNRTLPVKVSLSEAVSSGSVNVILAYKITDNNGVGFTSFCSLNILSK